MHVRVCRNMTAYGYSGPLTKALIKYAPGIACLWGMVLGVWVGGGIGLQVSG